jgi:hypothetical protein
LCKLDSSSRFYEEGGSAHPSQEHISIVKHKVGMLRGDISTRIKNIKRSSGVSFLAAIILVGSALKY